MTPGDTEAWMALQGHGHPRGVCSYPKATGHARKGEAGQQGPRRASQQPQSLSPGGALSIAGDGGGAGASSRVSKVEKFGGQMPRSLGDL